MDGIFEQYFDEEVRVWPVDTLDDEGVVHRPEPDFVACRIEDGVTIVVQGIGTDSVEATRIISHVEIPQDARVALPGDVIDEDESGMTSSDEVEKNARAVIRARRRTALDGSAAAYETYV